MIFWLILLFVSKRLDDAIETQEQAAELLEEKEITDFLTFLKNKKAAVKKAESMKSEKWWLPLRRLNQWSLNASDEAK